MLKDVKTRAFDHLRAAGFKIDMEDVRLWLYTAKSDDEDRNSKNKDYMKQLREACQLVYRGFNGELQQDA